MIIDEANKIALGFQVGRRVANTIRQSVAGISKFRPKITKQIFYFNQVKYY